MYYKFFKVIILSIVLIIFIIPIDSYSQDWLLDVLKERAFYSDLVIEGKVLAIEDEEIEIFIGSSRQPPSNVLTLEILKVWAGFYSNDTIQVVVSEVVGFPKNFSIGDHLLLTLLYDSKRLNRYFACQHTVLFVDNEQVFYGSGRSYRRKILIDNFWQYLEDITSSRNIENLTRASNIVVRGKIIKLIDYILYVEQSYKGLIPSGDTIKINLYGDNLTDFTKDKWSSYIQKGLKKDEYYIFFLKERGEAYYPFAGSNSIINVRNGDLFINTRKMMIDYTKIEEIIKKAHDYE